MNVSPNIEELLNRSTELLKQLISTPSFSREENKTAELIESFFSKCNIPARRIKNNIIAQNLHYSHEKKTILFNSHHDTVRPNSDWNRDPFSPTVEGGKLYGLGSNDAGGALITLLSTFVQCYEKELPFNLVIAATAEEEIAGNNGIELIFPMLGNVDFAIVGEPTQMKMAVAERGLMVLDCTARGSSGHAARNTGVNALYKAMSDISWISSFTFPRISAELGNTMMTVTQIQAGTQHNVVPDVCKFVVDVRISDSYTHQEVLQIIQENTTSEISPRSLRLAPSFLPHGHILRAVAEKLSIPVFGSPTMSDQALIPVPSIKIGPGMSERSHTADEYIEIKELRDGLYTMISIIDTLRELL